MCLSNDTTVTPASHPPMRFSSKGTPATTANSTSEHLVRSPFYRWGKRSVLYSNIQAQKHVSIREAPQRFEDLELSLVCPSRCSCSLTPTYLALRRGCHDAATSHGHYQIVKTLKTSRTLDTWIVQWRYSSLRCKTPYCTVREAFV